MDIIQFFRVFFDLKIDLDKCGHFGFRLNSFVGPEMGCWFQDFVERVVELIIINGINVDFVVASTSNLFFNRTKMKSSAHYTT